MNVGEYVRTYNGEIGIIINCPEELKKNYGNFLWFETKDEQRPIRKEDIIKSSPQIIDLIEVGDYVNGLRVEKNKYGELYTSYVYYGGDIGKQCEAYTNWVKEMQEENIYTIATHEQMEAMQYRVEK